MLGIRNKLYSRTRGRHRTNVIPVPFATVKPTPVHIAYVTIAVSTLTTRWNKPTKAASFDAHQN